MLHLLNDIHVFINMLRQLLASLSRFIQTSVARVASLRFPCSLALRLLRSRFSPTSRVRSRGVCGRGFRAIRMRPISVLRLWIFRGLGSSIILFLRGGIPRPIRNFPESLSPRILVGRILVGRLGVRAESGLWECSGDSLPPPPLPGSCQVYQKTAKLLKIKTCSFLKTPKENLKPTIRCHSRKHRFVSFRRRLLQEADMYIYIYIYIYNMLYIYI